MEDIHEEKAMEVAEWEFERYWILAPWFFDAFEQTSANYLFLTRPW